MHSALFYILYCGVEHCGVIMDRRCRDSQTLISLPQPSHFTCFVCFGFTCKIFSNKTFGNKILIACLVCLINVTLSWVRLARLVDNSLCIWISLCLHSVTVTRRHRWRQQTYICSFLCRERESSPKKKKKGRPASLFVWTHPLLSLSSLLELSAHCCFSLWRFSRTSVWRCIIVELYTQTNPLYYSPCLVLHTSPCLYLGLGARNLPCYLCILSVWERRHQCRKEIKKDVLQILYHSQEMTHLNSVCLLFLVWYESLSFS